MHPPATRLQVLLIEDNPVSALLLRSWLEADGLAAVTAVDTGEEGLRLAATRSWNLVITDVELPGMSGLALLEAVKAADPWAPVLVVTAHRSADYAQRALQSRADGLLFKPVAKEELLATATRMAGEAAERRRRHHKLVLAIGAHPDDVEIGCGGALAKHRARGDSLVILTLSQGMYGGNPAERDQEARQAAAVLNATLRWGGLHDTAISEGRDTISVIERQIAELRPTHVYTHSQNDNHQDHRNTHLATIVAAREVPNLYCYQSPSSTVAFQPHLFIDISSHLEDKLRAIAAYRSQTMQRAYLQEDFIRATARYWGRFSGYGLAEPMEVKRQRDT
ncbi:response regulator [Ottowia sp.]|uniref:response regulator n=1 Tax=Ottowia sp. TaxID=1898956 RepID=UPI0039E2C354